MADKARRVTAAARAAYTPRPRWVTPGAGSSTGLTDAGGTGFSGALRRRVPPPPAPSPAGHRELAYLESPRAASEADAAPSR